MQPDTLRQSDSIEVTAGPFAADRDLAAGLAGSELRNLAGVLADDPFRAVQSMPGVASSDDFRAQSSIREASFNRIGVYLDGILLHAPFHTVQGEPTTREREHLHWPSTSRLWRPHGRRAGFSHARRRRPSPLGASHRRRLQRWRIGGTLGFAFWDVQSKLAYALTPRHQLSLTAIDGHSGFDRNPEIVRLGPLIIKSIGAYLAVTIRRSGS